jgi:hypothetical protein
MQNLRSRLFQHWSECLREGRPGSASRKAGRLKGRDAYGARALLLCNRSGFAPHQLLLLCCKLPPNAMAQLAVTGTSPLPWFRINLRVNQVLCVVACVR